MKGLAGVIFRRRLPAAWPGLRAFGGVPPPPPGPPSWQAQVPEVKEQTSEGANIAPAATPAAPLPPPGPGLPQGLAKAAPRQDAKAVREVSSAGDTGPRLTSQEKYQQMLQRLHLPLTKDPNTPRPKPEDLVEGFFLRVQWSDGWWKARVLQAKEDEVKVRFDTWGPEHDEWIARDSQRLRLPLPDDQPADEDDAKNFVSAHVRDRPFVPKPFNPEKEFQKRQLRIREKVAAMQKTKIGYVDPSLTAKMKASSLSPEASLESVALIAEKSKLKQAESISPEAAALNVQAAEELVAQAEAPPPPPLEAEATPKEPDAPPPDVEEAAGPTHRDPVPEPQEAAPPKTEEAVASAVRDPVPEPQEVAPPKTEEAVASAVRDPVPEPQEAAPPKTEAVASAVRDPVPEPQEAVPPKTEAVASAVRWEELLTEQKERYYHEVATGRTQWELPSEGWVALLDDDGSKYYWNTETGTTQWDLPQ